MSLSKLPSEILQLIADYLEELREMDALIRTNRHCYKCLNLYLYQCDVRDTPGWPYHRSTGESRSLQEFLARRATVGVPVEIYLQSDGSWIYSLTFAIRWGHDEVARILLKHNVLTDWGWHRSPNYLHVLLQAVRCNQLAILQALLDKGLDINEHDNCDGYFNCTPLHLACRYGHVDIAEMLLKRGADTEALDYHGRRPLEWAVMIEPYPISEFSQRPGGLIEIVQLVKLLLDHGAKPEAPDEHRLHVKPTFLEMIPFFSLLDLKCLIERDPVDDSGTLLQGETSSPQVQEEQDTSAREQWGCQQCGDTYDVTILASAGEGQGNQQLLICATGEVVDEGSDASIYCIWCRFLWQRFQKRAQNPRCWIRRRYRGRAHWNLSGEERIGQREPREAWEWW